MNSKFQQVVEVLARPRQHSYPPSPQAFPRSVLDDLPTPWATWAFIAAVMHIGRKRQITNHWLQQGGGGEKGVRIAKRRGFLAERRFMFSLAEACKKGGPRGSDAERRLATLHPAGRTIVFTLLELAEGGVLEPAQGMREGIWQAPDACYRITEEAEQQYMLFNDYLGEFHPSRYRNRLARLIGDWDLGHDYSCGDGDPFYQGLASRRREFFREARLNFVRRQIIGRPIDLASLSALHELAAPELSGRLQDALHGSPGEAQAGVRFIIEVGGDKWLPELRNFVERRRHEEELLPLHSSATSYLEGYGYDTGEQSANIPSSMASG